MSQTFGDNKKWKKDLKICSNEHKITILLQCRGGIIMLQ